MALTALILSGVAVAAAIASVIFTALAESRARRAEQRAERAEQRAERAEQRAERAANVAELEHIGEIVDRLADAVEDSATNPHAPRRVTAERERLGEAVAASSFNLTSCSVYALHADAGLLGAVKGELEEAIGLARRGAEPEPEPMPEGVAAEQPGRNAHKLCPRA